MRGEDNLKSLYGFPLTRLDDCCGSMHTWDFYKYKKSKFNDYLLEL